MMMMVSHTRPKNRNTATWAYIVRHSCLSHVLPTLLASICTVPLCVLFMGSDLDLDQKSWPEQVVKVDVVWLMMVHL